MKTLYAILAFLVSTLCGAATNTLNVREITQYTDVRWNSQLSKESEWYKGESVRYIVWSMRDGEVVEIPTNALPVLKAWRSNDINTLYINATGTVIDAEQGNVMVTLTPSEANLPTNVYDHEIQLWQGTNYMGVVAAGRLRVRYSAAGDSIAYVGTQTIVGNAVTNIINGGTAGSTGTIVRAGNNVTITFPLQTGAVASVAYGVTDSTAYRGDWGDAVSNALASAGAIKSVIATSNGLATVTTSAGGTATVTVAASGILAVGASNYYPLVDGQAVSGQVATLRGSTSGWDAAAGWAGTNYLPISGGRMSGSIDFGNYPTPFMFEAGAKITWTSGTEIAWINSDPLEGGPTYLKTDTGSTNIGPIWWQDNDGAGSGLDADLLDGQHANQFATSGVLNALSSKNPVMSLSYNATNGLIYAGIIANEGGDLEYFWNGTRVSYGASQTVQLVAGTTNVPTQNYICALPDGTLTNYTAYPGFLARALMFEVFLADTGSIVAGNGYAIRSWTENVDGNYGRGRISHIGERVRKEPAIWESGVMASIVTSTTVSAYITTDSGVGWQMHRHTINANTNRDMWIINSQVGFREITNLTQIAATPSGTALFGANGDAYNIEVLAFVESGITPKSTRIMLSLATSAYTVGAAAQKLADALADVSKYDNPSVPGYMQGMSIRLARITMVRISAGNYYWIISDRRGQPLGTSGGGASGTAAALVLYNTNDAAGVVANIGGGVWSIGTNDAVGAGGGGSQTPWTNSINANQLQLTNLNAIILNCTNGQWWCYVGTNPYLRVWTDANGVPTNDTRRLGGVDYEVGR